MADKKISEFPTFFGTQDEKTYYIVSSGDPGEANSANYRVPFTDLAQAVKAVESELITATSGVFDVVSGASGIFTGELSVSGNPVLTGIEVPGVEGVILGGDEDNINFGGTEPGDNRSVNFQQDGDTKLKINEDGNVEVMQDFYVSGASTLNSLLVTGIFESQSVANFSGPAVNFHPNGFANFLGTNNLLGFNNLTGPTNINGSLAVNSPTFDIRKDTTTTFSGDTYFKGKSNFQDELNSSSLSKLGGSLTEITSSAFNIGQNVLTNFSGNVKIGGNLYVTGKTVTEEVETVTTSNGVVFEGDVLDGFEAMLKAGTLTADRTITLPDADGTVALTSDILPEANDLSASVTWVNVPDANITQSSVTQHQGALSITESQISDLGLYLTSVSWNDVGGKPSTFDPSAHTLSSHSDVSATAATAGQVLKWNGSAWAPGTDSAGTTIGSLSDISNVSATNPTDGQVLKWDGTNSQWAPAADDAGGTTIGSLSDISNVSATAPTNGQVLKWNGSAWAPGADEVGLTSVSWNDVGGKPSTFTPSAHTLSSHSDVSATAATAGQVLKWNGSAWAPAADDAGSSGTSSGASVTTDTTAPSNPSDGDLWFNENEAELYVYTASLDAWIQTNGGGGSGGETFSTGWVNTDGTTTVADGATLNFNHNLGTTDVIFTALVADNSSGANARRLGDFHEDDGSGGGSFGFGHEIKNITSTSVTLQLGNNGYYQMDSNGVAAANASGGNPLSFNGQYIKVVASSGGGGGGSNTAGLPRTQWPVRAVDGINTLNSFDFSVTGNQWKYSPQKRYNFVYPNSWVFNAVRGLNPSTGTNFVFSRDGDFVKFYNGANNAGGGCAALVVSNSGSYNRGGYIIAQTNETGYLQASVSNGPHTGFGADGNLMGIVSPTIVNNVVYNTSTTTSWATASTGYANSLVMLLMEPHQGGGGGNTFVKRKGDSNIINTSVSGNYAGKGCAALTVSGNSDSGGTPYWRGGYCFCMTDANGDLEVSSAVNSNLKMTVIGYVPSATTEAVIHNNASIAANPQNVTGSGSGEDGDYGTTISTFLSGYNLVLLKVIGSAGASMLFKTPGDSFTGYNGTSNAGWGASGVYVNNGNGGYVVVMTDANGNIKAMGTSVANATVTRVGSVPITLA